jgi:hypothetical protein
MRIALLHVLYVAALVTAGCGGWSGRGVGTGSAIETPPPAAGPAPLRRLTQEQYRNTVRELLGIKELGTDLPVDEGSAGFFGNTIAPVSELHLEKYGRAAELLARAAVQRLPGLLPCQHPVAEADRSACATRFIERFGRRAYRRPLTVEEKVTLQALYTEGVQTSGFEGGIRLVLEAVLQSPHFLYMVEPAPPGAREGSEARPVPIPPFALASRLSYFLWNSTPDETLLAAAEANQLRTREQIAAQTARMIADRRFRDTVSSFHLQWLDLTELDGVEKRVRLHPLFTHDLRASMKEETIRFADHVVREGDGRLDTLLKGRFTFVDSRLRELYGLGIPGKKPADKPAAAPVATAATSAPSDAKPGDKSADNAAEKPPEKPKTVHPERSKDTWTRVDLGQVGRGGLLTQASVMTRHSHWDQPSLVLRGKLIREKLLCTVLPPPPPDVNNTLPRADPKVSARERFEEHRSEVSCGRCHRLIDPLGVPFESYDAIGAHRTMDGPVPVDPSSELSGTKQNDGPVKDALELASRLAASQEVRDCVALQWFRYALGRDEGSADGASVAQIQKIFRESGYRVPALVAAIPVTDSFRYQQPQAPQQPPQPHEVARHDP